MIGQGTGWLRGLVMPLAFAVTGCSGEGTGGGNASSAGVGATAGFSFGAGTGGPSGIGAAGIGAAGRVGTGLAGIGAPAAAGRTGGGAAGTPTPGAGGAGTVAMPVAGAGTVGAIAGMPAAAGSGGGMGAAGSGMVMPAPEGACTPAPMGGAISDYGAKGPFETRQVSGTGPSNQYTMFRPATLGMGGFMHPPVTWGNGVTTTPDLYVPLLSTVASHGFVVIASNSTGVTAQDVRQGLEWLIMQNDVAGDFQGKLAVKCAGAIGYSMGGGAAVTAAAHPNVIATVSMHGLQGAANQLNGPLLLMTSTNDGFVTKEGFVQPTYAGSSKVPTIMATENVPGTPDFAGHLLPLGDSGNERAPLIAWLRLFIYGDQGTKDWFYGADCKLCKAPWIDIQRKNAMW